MPSINEAIKNNEEHSKHHRLDPYPAYFKALQLGIEALKKIQEQRNPDGWLGTLDLPGETKE